MGVGEEEGEGLSSVRDCCQNRPSSSPFRVRRSNGEEDSAVISKERLQKEKRENNFVEEENDVEGEWFLVEENAHSKLFEL